MTNMSHKHKLTWASLIFFNQNGWFCCSILIDRSLYGFKAPKFCLNIGRHDSKSIIIKPELLMSGICSSTCFLYCTKCCSILPSCGTISNWINKLLNHQLFNRITKFKLYLHHSYDNLFDLSVLKLLETFQDHTL